MKHLKYGIMRGCMILSAILIMIGVSGCMGGKKAHFTKEEMLGYLSGKYGVEFTYSRPGNAYQPNASSYTIFVTQAALPDKEIYVRCNFDKETGEKKFLDNYLSYLYEQQTADLLNETVHSVYPDAKVRYYITRTSLSSNSTESMMSFADYRKRSAAGIDFLVLLPPSHDQAKHEAEAKALADALAKTQTACSYSIAYAPDQAQYDQFVTDHLPDDEYVQYPLRGEFMLDADFNCVMSEWG